MCVYIYIYIYIYIYTCIEKVRSQAHATALERPSPKNNDVESMDLGRANTRFLHAYISTLSFGSVDGSRFIKGRCSGNRM